MKQEIKDPNEAILVLYVCAVFMNNEPAFDHIVNKNKFFKEKPELQVILSQYNIFKKL